MDNAAILRTAIEKAIANGWTINDLEKGSINDKERYIVKFTNPMQIRGLLFNHDFARALWGGWIDSNGDYHEQGYADEYQPAWQYHLQQMVIVDDPIKYLSENL